MKAPVTVLVVFAATALAHADSFREAYGSRFTGRSESQNQSTKKTGDAIHRWNQIAIDATGLDHTPVAPGENRVFGEQLGPGRASRAMAIVHIAIFDAVDALLGGYQSYTGVRAPHARTSLDAAVAQTAHDTLSALFPSQAASFDSLLSEDLALVRHRTERDNGVLLGQQVATTLLALRTGDGAQIPEPQIGLNYFTNPAAGHWQQDPISAIPLALGAHWGDCKPFVLESGNQFRAPPPPALNSAEYTNAYIEAKSVGGDGIVTPTVRTPEQTFIATFWAYDGTPSLCAPPRLYNQITVQMADRMKLSTIQLARLLALVNTAMADAAMAVWDSKYYYDFWRPITAIRGSNDNVFTVQDPDFMPLGAPASNLHGPNFTPPFPSYPSGHAGFGGAIFQIMRRFYGTDHIPFSFVSDEFDGITKDHDGNVRPYMPRYFSSFSQAEEENGQSRIYLGIHWSFDKTEGIAQGREVANYVFDHAFLRLRRK